MNLRRVSFGLSLFVFVSTSLVFSPLTETQTSKAKSSDVFDVRQFGAKGDGKTLDTPAINQAIEAAAAMGGGTGRLFEGRRTAGLLAESS